ncbi:MAG: hypothetical protein LBG60_15525, partial [Bifidobacteriaceae bacterium]|nr:hypothetical protein [Bifidobacteriaceae bacterium]
GTRRLVELSDYSYLTGTLQGAPAVARQGAVAPASGVTLLVSEVVRVVADGRIAHDVTVTNTGSQTYSSFDFGVLLDTMLDTNDRIPLIKSTANALYIENPNFRLYLAMTGGDRLMAGPWPNRSTLASWVNVANFNSGRTVLSGADSAVEYQALGRTLAPGQSLTLAFEERLFPLVEILPGQAHVKFVDDHANGATVQPVAGAVVDLTGVALSDIGLTEASAAALVPSGYRVESIVGPTVYDQDNSTVQEIVVHLSHIHVAGQASFTRTITYQGAGDATPAPVIQTQTFTTDSDLATGRVVYSNGTGYAAVDTPEVPDYWPLAWRVPAVAANAPATDVAPTNIQVTVRYVTDEPQVVIASDHGPEGGQAVISGRDSFDPRGLGELSYAWDLDNDGEYDDGDQHQATLALPLVGSYTVGLQVTDSAGRVNAGTFDVLAANVVPVVSIGADVSLKADGVFKRAGSFTDPGADTWKGEVLYGDGGAAQALTLNGKSFNLDHRYAKPGTYTVTVRIFDITAGTTGEAKIKVTVPEDLALTGPADALPLSLASASTMALGLALLVVGLRLRRPRLT